MQLGPDVIVTHGEAQIQALRRETSEIPIVVAITGDLVSVGHAQSIAHPGGNVTGLVDISPELSAKRLQLLHRAPARRRPASACCESRTIRGQGAGLPRCTQDAALNLGKEPVSLPIGSREQDLERRFARPGDERIDALVILHDPSSTAARPPRS